MVKQPAVLFRRKVYVGHPRHQDAINAAFKGMSKLAMRRAYDRVSEGKETIVFGFANPDGTDFKASEDFQEARKLMYGFD